MSWEYITLGDIASFSNGINFDKSAYSLGIKLISVSDFGNRFSPDFTNLQEVKKETVRENDYLKEGDIVFVRSNGNKELVGRCMLIQHLSQPVTFSGFVIRGRIQNTEKYDPVFFTYHFKNIAFRRAMSGTAVGANIQNLSQSRLSAYVAKIPNIDTQRRIAHILSAYDNLIENNQRQIRLLEEAAQRLYKEWFVDLRFPGYENTPIVDGVPEGWEKVPISELISYEIGGGWGEETPTVKCTKEAYVIRGTDFYGITHGDLLSIPFRFHAESNLSSRKLMDGDIVFEVSGGSRTEGVARCLLVTSAMLDTWRNNVMCASFCKLIRPQKGYSYYLHDCFKYLRATGKTEEYDKRSASSIVNYRWKDFLVQEKLFNPSSEIIEQYSNYSSAIYSKIANCSLQILSANNARDRLLPKLMSGEIEV